MIDWTRLVTAEARAAAGLAEARATALAEIAALVAEARRAVITDLPGQEMVYLAKEAEAARWLADPAPDPAGYPLLAAETGLTAPDGHQLAQLWLNMGSLWRDAAARLEALRMQAAAAIAAAGTPAEARAVARGAREALAAREGLGG